MIPIEVPEGLNKAERYNYLHSRIKEMNAEENDPLAVLCNTVSFLYWTLGDVNWVGFYILRGDKLVLGPFTGKPACPCICVGFGVCGTAAQKDSVQIVPKVEEFPGHIPCDSISASEMVLPIHVDGSLWGVMDLDSPRSGRFDEADQCGLEQICQSLDSVFHRLPL